MNYGKLTKRLAAKHGFIRTYTDEEIAAYLAAGERVTPKRSAKIEERRAALAEQMIKRWKLDETDD